MVGLILTTYNQLDDTKATLQSLEATTNTPYKLVIVDNGSTDGSIPYLKQQGYEVIENVDSVSLTVALNQGLHYFLAYPEVEYIGWIHNDMTFYRSWLQRLLDFLEQNPLVGKVAPTSLHQFGPDDPDIAEQFMHQNQDVFYPGNACPWVMPRHVIEKVGFFDERFIKCGGYEDWDFNNRVLEEGFSVMITRSSVVWHPAMGTRKHHDESESGRKNAELYSQKWGPHPRV